ncbi:MAG TPA: cytochrome c biogenesis protein ResB [Pyrinomonadaceae bacterium]|nr:cytochrome c biogenesis protein ResB [Pyrinomonadaceae bacterium]
MSAAEDSIKPKPAVTRKSAPILNRFLDFVSSVRFGVVQLCLLVVLAMIGMLVLQQNVEGFDAYYVSLTPAEKVVFGKLGFFDIYHSWYFNLLLLTLSLNIILASIDRFPSAWSYIVKPKVKGTKGWLLARKDNETINFGERSIDEVKDAIQKEFRTKGFKTTVSEDKGGTFVFGENGKWNRLGAYIVHVFLLTLFLGHFVALQTGFDADVRMIPGATTSQIQLIQYNLDKKERFNVNLPFSMECTDVQQRLIDEKGNIDVTNTLDWRTQLKIEDPSYGTTIADVSLNKPYSYRGYRFFQAQTIPVGNARTIKLELRPEGGGQPIFADISRNGETSLPDGTKVEYDEFMPDFVMGSDGKPDTRSGEYNQPAAILNVTPPNGERTRVFAMPASIADRIPMGNAKLGYKWRLAEFEKAPLAHILSIKYDPFEAAFIAWYIGGFGLIGALMFVFFLSHKRVWAHIEKREDGTTEVVLAGEANRNQLAFGDRFKKISDDLKRM